MGRCGLKGFFIQAPFAPSLLVEIRKRMGIDVFEQLHQALINQLERRTPPTDPRADEASANSELTEHTSAKEASTEAVVDNPESDVISDQKQEPITHQERLLLDATVAEQTIRFPTDLSLLNESREISERLIDGLYTLSSLTKKPRTYRKIARSTYLAIVKQRRLGPKKIRSGILVKWAAESSYSIESKTTKTVLGDSTGL